MILWNVKLQKSQLRIINLKLEHWIAQSTGVDQERVQAEGQSCAVAGYFAAVSGGKGEAN